MLNFHILMCLVLINVAVDGEKYEISGSFLECQTDTLHNHLQFDENCFTDEISSKKVVSTAISRNISVLSRRQYYMEEIGFECSIKKSKITYIQDFFFNKYIAGPIVEIVSLTRLECMALINDQLCNKIPMNCKNNQECHFTEKPIVDFPFWTGKNAHIFYECKFSQKMVVASTNHSIVIHDAITPCYSKDGVCFLPTSTVIWETNFLRECPYEKILDISLMYSQPLENGHHALFSVNDNYLFELVESVHECGILLTSTTQGLYLAIDPNVSEQRAINKLPISRLKMEHFQEKDYRDLILAESDYKMMLFKNEIYKLECSLMLNTIRTHLDEDDTFLKINYLGETDIILYIKNGQAYVPMCSNVSIIYVNDNEDEKNFFKGYGMNKNCYKDLKIEYKRTNSNITKTGFLRNSEIITPKSTKINCLNTEILKEIILQNKYRLTQQADKILISNYTSTQTKLKTRNSHLNNLFFHHSFLTNGTDLISNLDEFLEINNDISKYSNKEGIDEETFGDRFESVTRKGGYFDNIIIGIVDLFSLLFETGKNLIAIAFITLIGYVLFKIIFKCFPLFSNCLKTTFTKRRNSINNNFYNENEIEMERIN